MLDQDLYSALGTEEIIARLRASHLIDYPLVREVVERLIDSEDYNTELISKMDPDEVLSMV